MVNASLRKCIIRGYFLEEEVSGGVADAIVLLHSHHPRNTPHIRWAFTISLCANSILLRTPATFHLRNFSQPTCGADKKCQGVNALGRSLETMTDESRRTNIPLSLSLGGTTLECVPHDLPEHPSRLEPQVLTEITLS